MSNNVTPSTTDSSDRLAEIRARLDAIGAWRLREEPEVFTQNAEGTFRTWAPHDIAWLLDEVEAWRNHCGCCDCQRLRGNEVIGCICEKCKRYKQEQADA